MDLRRSISAAILAVVAFHSNAWAADDAAAPMRQSTIGKAAGAPDANARSSSGAQDSSGSVGLPASTAQRFGPFEVVVLTRGNRLLRQVVGRDGGWTAQMVSGLPGRLIGIDWRPADARLYGINDANDLFRIDPDSGRAERVSSLTLGFEGSESSAFDFNPQADRLRLIAGSGQNLRVQVVLGAVAADGPLEFAPGDRHAGSQPRVTAAAYTRNVAQAPTTRLFDIDWKLDALLFQDPPNDGVLQTVGPLGVDFGELAGFDILTGKTGEELAIAVSGRTLHRVDLETGSATPIGTIPGDDVQAIGISLIPASSEPR